MTQPIGIGTPMPGNGQVNPKSTTYPGAASTFAPDEIETLLMRLAEPFPPELVEWRVTATTRDRRGNRGQVVAYADQRAYTDRLNSIFSPLGWTREYMVQTVQNFERPHRSESGSKDSSIAAKVMVTCRVTIFGMGTHSGTGEEWATDENALTRAEAQAFKRACSCFGLGRYFYDLPRTWVDLDDQRRPLEHPRLPDWALPKRPEHVQRRPAHSGSHSGASSGRNGKDSLYRAEIAAVQAELRRRSNCADGIQCVRASANLPFSGRTHIPGFASSHRGLETLLCRHPFEL